ncbi:MAG: hypothetical protein P8123_11005 [bacterium]|jgi:hypothetical protein
MAFRRIAVETKVEAVKRVLRGEHVTSVADALSIDRNSLAIWVRRVLDSMRSSFQRKKVERKRVVVRSEAKFRKLQEKIERQGKTIDAMRNSLRVSEEGPTPEKCPACGCARFYKNGLIMMELERLLGVRLNGANRKIPVQKFICVNCGKGTHLDGPAALYHWVTGGGERSKGKRASKSIRRADVLFET